MHKPGRLAWWRAHCVDRASSSVDQSAFDAIQAQNFNRAIHGIAFANGSQINLQAWGTKFNSISQRSAEGFPSRR